jgi:uncharacterized protein
MTVPIAVLDTNVVLDWLVFREPGVAPLVAAIEARRVCWVASDWMRGELQHVVGRGLGERWLTDWTMLSANWDHWVNRATQPDPVAPAGRLYCSDPQDQPFIDLALAVGARWLVSRDRALLKLARRATPRGLSVLTPEAWAHEEKKKAAEAAFPISTG